MTTNGLIEDCFLAGYIAGLAAEALGQLDQTAVQSAGLISGDALLHLPLRFIEAPSVLHECGQGHAAFAQFLSRGLGHPDR